MTGDTVIGSMLVAGVGNIFRGDDGFGGAVVGWLAEHAAAGWGEQVRLRDYGIRGVHLAYELLDGYDDVVLVDAVHQDGAPGSLYVFEPRLDGPAGGRAALLDAHDLAPESVLALVPLLGGSLGRVTVVGCEPASLDDRMGLSQVVSRRVPDAARLVCDLVASAGHAPGWSQAGARGTVRG